MMLLLSDVCVVELSFSVRYVAIGRQVAMDLVNVLPMKKALVTLMMTTTKRETIDHLLSSHTLATKSTIFISGIFLTQWVSCQMC